jgi:hypothetical protein
MSPSLAETAPANRATAADPPALLLHWIFRVAMFMEFVGHGAFGLIGKAAWVPYFEVAGIPEPWAWRLMPVVGSVDILVGVVTLFRPMRAMILYGALWGLWTALARPLSGEPLWEALERAGNYGVPFAFLLWSGWPRRASEWLTRIEPRAGGTDRATRGRVGTILRLSLALLLIGHGGFGALMNKEMLVGHYSSIGIHGLPFGSAPLVPAVGWFEIALGCAVMAWPATGLLLFIALWKIACELLYPISGAPFWEFVERGGSYAAPLALIVLASLKHRAGRPAPRAAAPMEGTPA